MQTNGAATVPALFHHYDPSIKKTKKKKKKKKTGPTPQNNRKKKEKKKKKRKESWPFPTYPSVPRQKRKQRTTHGISGVEADYPISRVSKETGTFQRISEKSRHAEAERLFGRSHGPWKNNRSFA